MTVAKETSLSEYEIEQVRAQLDRISESVYFHGSQRCSRFLQYSVESVLSGGSSRELKERTIGIEVFNRVSDYDTGQDSTVRVTANEVRKRLAQYYNSAVTDDPIIELPIGSYAVVFRWAAKQGRESGVALPAFISAPVEESGSALSSAGLATPEPPSTKGGRTTTLYNRRTIELALVSVLLLAAVIASVNLALRRRNDPTTEVWAPLLNSQKAITICVAEPVLYLPEPKNGSTEYAQLPDSVIGIGDAYALSWISGFLESRGKTWRLLPSSNASFRDLSAAPLVLIGTFSNQWADRLLGSLRYVFVEGSPNKLVDRSNAAGGWTIPVNPHWGATEDYALISRFKSPDTGETIVALGGATNFGTEAAGKFLTNSEMLAAAMHDAPKGWQTKNFQIVLHVKVQSGAPEPPTVVTRYFW